MRCVVVYKKLFMLENPRNSLFWLTTVWIESVCAHELYFQDHQACGYGSKRPRPKWTRLAAIFPEVSSINAVCPGDHQHEGWGLVQRGSKRVFATSLEVRYPKRLCEAIVHAFILRLVAMGMTFNQQPSLQRAARTATLQQNPLANCHLSFQLSSPDWLHFTIMTSWSGH